MQGPHVGDEEQKTATSERHAPAVTRMPMSFPFVAYAVAKCKLNCNLAQSRARLQRAHTNKRACYGRPESTRALYRYAQPHHSISEHFKHFTIFFVFLVVDMGH